MSAQYSIDDLIAEVSDAQLENPEWRAGQTYFNVLASRRPDLAGRIRSGSDDPFYADERIPALIAFLVQNWEPA